jgi:dynein heavy chain
MGDVHFKKILEVAIELGKVVLVENLPERVDVNIESLVKQQISKYQDMRMIKFCRKQIKIEKTFKLILVSNLSKPNYDVNFTNHVTIVNFYVSLEGLS